MKNEDIREMINSSVVKNFIDFKLKNKYNALLTFQRMVYNKLMFFSQNFNKICVFLHFVLKIK